ncbi:transposase [Pseudomonas frederiksbergensis]|uniref:transposase n=1 Tax=Pseudomonas frederiksbergensis TaxID=104087 RepID=UPI000F46C26B|nr:transposase [Pseudomonas frederiksbergensis]RON55592.1 transposase [Pseudomonas frederiksbergensis]
MKPQERFALILNRQSRFDWGGEYVPSTLAVPREAPKGSRISRLHSRKLRRTVHLLSGPEKVFAQLALYHPDLFELHEQKMLWPVNAGHPLRGHPLTKGTFPPPLRGTVDIAREIGFKHHEIVVEDASGNRRKIPYPYQGDLLLYLLNSRGEPYAVNWTVKDRAVAFRERRSSSPKTPVQQRKDREHAELRGELERRYYASAGIRTVEVSRDLVSPTIQANLDLLFGMHDLDFSLEAALLEDFSGAVSDAVQIGKPVAYVAIEHSARWGFRDQFIAKIYQDIWDRKLLVDFSESILIDRPLVTGGCDLLQEFGSFFQEVAS